MESATSCVLPTVTEDLVEGLPKGCAWGIWDHDGKKDVYGTLNLLTPQVVQKALAEATDGVHISLKYSDPSTASTSQRLMIEAGPWGPSNTPDLDERP